MGVSSYFEFVVTLMGWVMYDNLYSVLASSGIVYLPFLIMIASHIIHSRKAGDDEGSAAIQSLKRIETDLVIMVLVLSLCVIPVKDVALNEMRYTKPALDCQLAEQIINGDDTDTAFDQLLSAPEIGGQTGRIPVWWAVIHIVSKSVTSASIAGLPCVYDLASVETTLANDNIEDPQLHKELRDFMKDCYMPSKAKLINRDPTDITPTVAEETNWLGSEYFLNTNGYYNTYYSQTPRQDWPYLASRDAGFEADQSVGGHPNCNDWWSNGSIGLRRQVLDSINNDIRDKLIYSTDSLLNYLFDSNTTQENENVLLRKYLAITTDKHSYTGATGNLATTYSVSSAERYQERANDGPLGILSGIGAAARAFTTDTATTAMAAVGAAITIPSAMAEGEMIREGVSIFQGILLMMFILLLPFLQVFGLYKPSTVLTLSVIFFALHFFSFLFAMAFWVDNNLMTVLLDGSIFAPVTNPTQAMILLWTQRFMYLLFPMIYLTAMGWIGFNFGQIGREMSMINSKASEVGKKGGEVSSAALTKGAAAKPKS